jgi:probable phosphoglycerate mutase
LLEILFIRHGETQWNVDKRLQGHLDIGLNREGLRQATALGRTLLQQPLDAIFSSDLRRAADTAKAIAMPHGMQVQTDAGLRERCFGAFEGLLHPEIEQRYPPAFAAWKRRDLDARYPCGQYHAETLREFAVRVLACVTRLAAADENYRRIVIVTHGGVLDTMYRHVHKLPYEHPRDFPVLNGSINRLSWDGSNFRILQWADVAHLARPARDEVDNAR